MLRFTVCAEGPRVRSVYGDVAIEHRKPANGPAESKTAEPVKLETPRDVSTIANLRDRSRLTALP
jgi:hypothetical protein